MTYSERVAQIAKEISAEANFLAQLEKSRSDWVEPERQWVSIGNMRCYVVGRDGKVIAGFEGMQREALKIHDERIAASKSRIEGLRFRLVQIAKQGGSA